MKKIRKGLFVKEKNNKFEGANYIGNFSHIRNCNIGYMSYFGSRCLFQGVKIGKYCSIASEVSVISGEHPTSGFVSTHPAFYSLKTMMGITFAKQKKFDEYIYADKENKYKVVIGNDVWIATGAKILSGVHIGNGAIIAAGAVVTKDVEPYSIVGGVPAKLIRKRFSEEDIAFLEKLQWWDNDTTWLKEHSDYFTDIEELKRLYALKRG